MTALNTSIQHKGVKDCDVRIEIGFSGEIHVQIETERLVLTPVKPEDAALYHSDLYGDAEVMKYFATGEVRPLEKVEARVSDWVERWRNGNPFSALTVRTRNGEFVGQIVAGGGSEPGCSEMAYLICRKLWGQGYGKEAAAAVVKYLAPLLRVYGYQVDGGDFESLEATARPDNPASGKILRSLGFDVVSEAEKHGHLRQTFGAKANLPEAGSSWEILAFDSGLAMRELL